MATRWKNIIKGKVITLAAKQKQIRAQAKRRLAGRKVNHA
jgi:hypothetical protein